MFMEAAFERNINLEESSLIEILGEMNYQIFAECDLLMLIN